MVKFVASQSSNIFNNSYVFELLCTFIVFYDLGLNEQLYYYIDIITVCQ